MEQAPDGTLIAECSQIIHDGFVRYNAAFRTMTRGAQTRFEHCDWKGHQGDIVERVSLYEGATRPVVTHLRRVMGDRYTDHALWNAIRSYFGDRLKKVPDADLARTFFNSVTRGVFETLGIDPQLEFVTSSLAEGIEMAKSLTLRRYPYWGSVEKSFETILEDFCFRVPYSDVTANATRIAAEVGRHIRKQSDLHEDHILRFEFIDTFFFQAARAYMMGRIILQKGVAPIVIAFKNTDDGIDADAVLLSEEEVSIVLSYTRSYFFADPNTVVGAVHFIHRLLPRKPIDELFTLLGRLQQGKTERYRAFTKHLESTTDRFVQAEGDRGLVMIVFTLPSHDLVFKVMRDRFGYPKTVTREQVVEKYGLVAKHDRAGRLIDTQEFMNLELPVARFADALLHELLQEGAQSVSLVGDNLLFSRVYIERRVKPLNLYMRSAKRNEAQLAILDFGQAFKDLAQTNIFPGDLLLKNFGVTRQRRVIFYDFDEVMLITECNFRDMPEPGDDVDELRAGAWFYVGEHDIFPQEFINFLAIDAELRSLFLEVHGDLLTADYWRAIKARHLAGEVSVVVPYFRPTRPLQRPQTLLPG
jgi:isocitrate dehydrogenase kinase/phosphatase